MGPSSDISDLAHEVRRLFEDLAQRRPERRMLVSGECSPLLDVLETERTVEIVLDLPGVTADSLAILIKNGVVIIVGEKERPEPSLNGPTSFHLVERDFGRFARGVRVPSAVDGSAARARLSGGELRIVLPKLQERRGLEIRVAVESDAPAP
jgi:HSP20 family protein